MLSKLFTPPPAVIPMSWGAIIGYALLTLLAASVTTLGAKFLTQGGGWLIAASGALACASVHRFFRAIAPGDTVDLCLAAIVIALLVVAMTAVLRNEPAAAAIGAATWLVASTLAFAIDHLEERMHMIPLSWGLLLVGGLFGFMFVADSNR